ncbi:Protein N-acetyltransferase, RimJ/RimL family [Halobacillus dabanensis]|uniref:Protein N-acetyltransferase, RimJ/RimL family n=1 Tax=Halobacillus dabanensis TaxID=240302 RepID=A0A1I3TE21_HALDA|nr:GNAT family N-acetyltransferase [Halobacillus dabanensis]SFJ68743.1 Protein N-acetyltransferase, RimJ/RimL family [Halobacillus dabanensis]
MSVTFEKLTEPTREIAESYNQWENDPDLIPMIRPNKDKEAAGKRYTVTAENLRKRLQDHEVFLIYVEGVLVGEMNYIVNPGHLFDKRQDTAWIGITIGEPDGRGKGAGYQAMRFLEKEIAARGLKRIELGVFEFNETAHKLYRKLGYREVARIPDFTYKDGSMWADIRMEKHL